MNLSRRDFVKTAAVFGGLALTGCGGSKGGSDAPAPASDFTLVKEGTLIVASDLDFSDARLRAGLARSTPPPTRRDARQSTRKTRTTDRNPSSSA